VRKLECERLDRLLLAVWSRALSGDLDALDRALALMKRRAALLGLDAPRKIAPTEPDGERPYGPEQHALYEAAAELLAKVSAREAAEAMPSGDAGPGETQLGPADPSP
jgi:hypothetical protein